MSGAIEAGSLLEDVESQRWFEHSDNVGDDFVLLCASQVFGPAVLYTLGEAAAKQDETLRGAFAGAKFIACGARADYLEKRSSPNWSLEVKVPIGMRFIQAAKMLGRAAGATDDVRMVEINIRGGPLVQLLPLSHPLMIPNLDRIIELYEDGVTLPAGDARARAMIGAALVGCMMPMVSKSTGGGWMDRALCLRYGARAACAWSTELVLDAVALYPPDDTRGRVRLAAGSISLAPVHGYCGMMLSAFPAECGTIVDKLFGEPGSLGGSSAGPPGSGFQQSLRELTTAWAELACADYPGLYRLITSQNSGLDLFLVGSAMDLEDLCRHGNLRRAMQYAHGITQAWEQLPVAPGRWFFGVVGAGMPVLWARRQVAGMPELGLQLYTALRLAPEQLDGLLAAAGPTIEAYFAWNAEDGSLSYVDMSAISDSCKMLHFLLRCAAAAGQEPAGQSAVPGAAAFNEWLPEGGKRSRWPAFPRRLSHGGGRGAGRSVHARRPLSRSRGPGQHCAGDSAVSSCYSLRRARRRRAVASGAGPARRRRAGVCYWNRRKPISRPPLHRAASAARLDESGACTGWPRR